MAEAARVPSMHDIAPPSHPLRRATDHEPPPALHPGWTPAHDDASPKAADERARAALRIGHENRLELGDVRAELAEIGAGLRSLVKVLKGLGALVSPVVVGVLVGFIRDGLHWIATLHH